MITHITHVRETNDFLRAYFRCDYTVAVKVLYQIFLKLIIEFTPSTVLSKSRVHLIHKILECHVIE